MKRLFRAQGPGASTDGIGGNKRYYGLETVNQPLKPQAIFHTHLLLAMPSHPDSLLPTRRPTIAARGAVDESQRRESPHRSSNPGLKSPQSPCGVMARNDYLWQHNTVCHGRQYNEISKRIMQFAGNQILIPFRHRPTAQKS